jgi:hypothetical protein
MVMSGAGLAGTPSKYHADFLALFRDPAFTNEPDATKQMLTATHILRGKKEKVPFSAIASFFNVTKKTVQQHWKRSRRGMFAQGRLATIPDGIKSLMFHYITQEFLRGRPVC